jgi:cobalt-zinc-cadmium efflux system outer membrane protein
VSQKRLVDQTRLDLMTQLWQLRSDVRRAYTEVVVAQETLKTLNELYDLSAKLENVASKRFQAGDVPELDALKARLATSQANVDRVVGAQRVVRARQQLSIILGRGVESPINIPGLPDYTGGNKVRFELKADKTDVLPDFSKSVEPLSIFESMAEENRLELKSLAVQRKLNDVNLKGAYGNMIPNPSLAFGKSVQGNVPTGPKLTAVFFTLNAPLPTVNFNQGPIYQYKATGRQLKYQTAAQRNQIGTDVASAYQNLLAQREKLRTYQEHVLAESFEVARLARRSYEVGQSDITATLAAQQANVQVRSAYLDAVQSYQLAFTDLEQACGTPLE